MEINTQSIKGGNSKTTEVGYILISLRHNQDRISIDDFTGHGDSYKQREQQEIMIIENGNMLFSGTKYELFEILKNNNLNG